MVNLEPLILNMNISLSSSNLTISAYLLLTNSMNDNDRRMALKLFADYYDNAEFNIFQIEKREFGVGIYKKIDNRHLSFESMENFRRYLLTNTPMFVSHSISYYEFPSATPIERKNWQGADLIFDLDMHADGKYEVYPKLEEVKQDAIRLAEDFLLTDFGISKKDILYVFSGNRGYHIHVRDKNFADLGGDERREIVDYIRGTGLDYIKFFDFDSGGIKGRATGPNPDESGYRGRFTRAAIALIESEPAKISRIFSKQETRDKFIASLRKGNWSNTSIKDIIPRLRVVADTLSVHSVDTDAGVTQDLSKLIRVPNTIHGETGLIAKIIDNMDEFDPLNDALIKTNDTKAILFIEDVPELELAGSTFGPFKKDEKRDLPIAVAMFFVLKGSANSV